MLAIDFDETLNFSKRNQESFVPNTELIEILKLNKFFVLTARNENEKNINRVNSFLKKFDLKPEIIIFTNGEEKGPFLKKLSEDHDISFLVDDKEYQRDSANSHGFIGIHPDEFIYEQSKKIKKESRLNKIKEMWKEL